MQVYSVHNHLCHKKVEGNLQVSLEERNDFLKKISDLVELIETIYPKYFSSEQADDIRDKLDEVSVIKKTQHFELCFNSEGFQN